MYHRVRILKSNSSSNSSKQQLGYPISGSWQPVPPTRTSTRALLMASVVQISFITSDRPNKRLKVPPSLLLSEHNYASPFSHCGSPSLVPPPKPTPRATGGMGHSPLPPIPQFSYWLCFPSLPSATPHSRHSVWGSWVPSPRLFPSNAPFYFSSVVSTLGWQIIFLEAVRFYSSACMLDN